MKILRKTLFLILLYSAILFPSNVYAAIGYGIEDVFGESIWMGWTVFESGNKGYAATPRYAEDAYGRYQFDYRYELVPFLKYCVETDPESYKQFSEYIAYGAGNIKLQESKYGLQKIWQQYYNRDPEGFADLQDQYMFENYYLRAKELLLKKGIDLDHFNDPVLNGTVYSIAVRDGAFDVSNLRSVWQTYKEGDELSEWLDDIYKAEARRHPSQHTRWDTEQRYAALSGGVTTGVLGHLGTVMSSDGSLFTDYVEEWITKYKDSRAKGFIESGGWNEENKEWCETLVTAGNWQEMYGIVGGSLDFASGISGGVYEYIDGISIDAKLFEIPDNGSNMPIPYFSQGGNAPWAGIPFGGGNIASSGCSVTSLAMVVSYLNGGVNQETWTFPSDIVAEIAKRYGNYNYFYAADGSGQRWDIFPAVARMYGLSCNQISSGSIVQSLKQGRPVIMSCRPGEFTKKGHFIVITGVDEDGYCYVNDPNSNHASYSYKKYPASYLASQGKGWWSFGK